MSQKVEDILNVGGDVEMILESIRAIVSTQHIPKREYESILFHMVENREQIIQGDHSEGRLDEYRFIIIDALGLLGDALDSLEGEL